MLNMLILGIVKESIDTCRVVFLHEEVQHVDQMWGVPGCRGLPNSHHALVAFSLGAKSEWPHLILQHLKLI